MAPTKKPSGEAPSPKRGRPIPRPFAFHWGGGHIVEEASFTGKYTEPSIQLLEYEGDSGSYGLRFCHRAMASNSCFLLMEGKFTEAATAIGQAFAYARQHVPGELPVQIFGLQTFNLRHLQGRLEEAEPGLRALIQQYPQSFIRCMLAFAHSETGREEEARHEFAELARDDFAGVPRTLVWLPALQQLSETCATLGDAQRAGVLYRQLSPYAGQNIVGPYMIAMTGSASRQLGMLAAVMERYDDAERHFEDALAFDQKMNARPWVAHDQYNYAKMLLARAAPAEGSPRRGDGDRALALLQPALDTAEELGMKKIIERALALKMRAQGSDGGSI